MSDPKPGYVIMLQPKRGQTHEQMLDKTMSLVSEINLQGKFNAEYHPDLGGNTIEVELVDDSTACDNKPCPECSDEVNIDKDPHRTPGVDKDEWKR